MNPTLVSRDLLQELFEVFVAGAEVDDDPLNEVEYDDEHAIKAALKERLLPYFYDTFTDETQVLLKKALAFYISKPGFDFEDFFNNYLPAFTARGNHIIEWTWEVMFPAESIEAAAHDCIEDPAVTAAVVQRKYRPRA